MKKKMPWILKGHFTEIRDTLVKKYTIEEIRKENIWYREVIERPEADFTGIHHSDIEQLYHYFDPTPSDLINIKEKYGNHEMFTVVIENLIHFYERAYQNAIIKLKTINPTSLKQ